MTDIVERLRQSVTKGHEPTDDLAIEAADEIERMRGLLKEYAAHAEPYWKAEIERLRDALAQRTTDEPGTQNINKSKSK